MKKMSLILMLFAVLWCLCTSALAQEQPLYTAVTNTEFRLRTEKGSDDYSCRIPLNSKVKIFEISDDWCRITVSGEAGWCKARWLSHFYPATIPSEEQYQAISDTDFSLMLAPNANIKIGSIPNGKFVSVYIYGDEWCEIGYNGMVGWCKTDYLWAFRSLDVLTYPAIGAESFLGFVTLNEETRIFSDDFVGMTAVPGTLICVRSANEDEYLLPVWRSQGTISREAGKLTSFKAWDEATPGDIIGGFTTFYHKDYGKDLSENRAYNIALACERIHDVVLQPGEQFSYNALCAPYRQHNGYLLAPNISAKGTGYGGGVCQLTTTLYNAVLPLPLQLDEWRVHRKIGVAYVPQYFDAAVGSVYDFIFTNTLPYPIRIWAQPQNGAITVLIYVDGTPEPLTITESLHNLFTTYFPILLQGE